MRELTFIVKVDVPDELLHRGFADAVVDALCDAVDTLGRTELHNEGYWPFAFQAGGTDWESLPESLDIQG